MGRVANRISNAEFSLDGTKYSLDKNNGKHCLHGGLQGISWKNWVADILPDATGVKFTYVSADGVGGFPGEVWFDANYKLDYSEDNITIEYKAITDKNTPVDLTNHVYLNLNGHNSNVKIYNHSLMFNADKYLDFDKDEITVTGQINSVENTKYDFRKETLLDSRIKSEGKWPEEGYDNYFILNKSSDMGHVAL